MSCVRKSSLFKNLSEISAWTVNLCGYLTHFFMRKIWFGNLSVSLCKVWGWRWRDPLSFMSCRSSFFRARKLLEKGPAAHTPSLQTDAGIPGSSAWPRLLGVLISLQQCLRTKPGWALSQEMEGFASRDGNCEFHSDTAPSSCAPFSPAGSALRLFFSWFNAGSISPVCPLWCWGPTRMARVLCSVVTACFHLLLGGQCPVFTRVFWGTRSFLILLVEN